MMELLLWSGLLLSGYMGIAVLRRLGPMQRMYAFMLLGDAVLCVVALAYLRDEDKQDLANLIGTVGLGGAAFLILVPPLLQRLARNAVGRERLGLAKILLEARELLQPGMGARQEKETVDAISAVKRGEVEKLVAELSRIRGLQRDPRVVRNINERIITTYLFARRFAEAIELYEKMAEEPRFRPTPHVAAEMVRAYAETGDMDAACRLQTLVEELMQLSDPLVTALVNRARLVYLAFVGKVSAVQKMVATRGPFGFLPPTARHYWVGVALSRAGRRDEAVAAFEKAAQKAPRGTRARLIAEEHLKKIDTPGVLGPHQFSDEVNQLAEDILLRQAGAKNGQPQLHLGMSWRELPVTVGLILSNVLVALVVSLAIGPTSDIGVLVSAGANYKIATQNGEWWRLITATFLHIGIWHLLLNMYGLWQLGQLIEQMFGRVRMLVLYLGAGIIASVVSLLTGSGTSAGASGAIFGLLGACLIELWVFRKKYPARIGRGLLNNLLFFAVANVAIGFSAGGVIDQAAHLGGLCSGGLLALALSQHTRFARSRAVEWGMKVLALVLVVATAASGIFAARTSFSQTVLKVPWVQRAFTPFRVEIPAHWEILGGDATSPGFAARDLGASIAIEIRAEMAGDVQQLLDVQSEGFRKEASRSLGLASVKIAPSPVLRVPAEWSVREFVATLSQPMSGDQTIGVAIFARQVGFNFWVGLVYYPRSTGAEFSIVFNKILESLRTPDNPG